MDEQNTKAAMRGLIVRLYDREVVVVAAARARVVVSKSVVSMDPKN